MDESTIRALIKIFEGEGDRLHWWLNFWTWWVVVGCTLEAVFIFHTYFDERSDWRKARNRGAIQFPEKPSLGWIAFEIASLILVVGGIAGELYIDIKSGDNETNLRDANAKLVTLFNDKASAADERSKALGHQTQGLLTDAAIAKRDMVTAQLELARLTGPIQEVPVIDGVAEPSPLMGTKLRILLHRNITIKFPTLPKGMALSWRLILVEDAVGQHQFKTFPKQFMPGPSPGESYLLYLEPGTSISMDLISDETGTVDQSFGGATIMNPTVDTTKPK